MEDRNNANNQESRRPTVKPIAGRFSLRRSGLATSPSRRKIRNTRPTLALKCQTAVH
jgi:hypothetical protein